MLKTRRSKKDDMINSLLLYTLNETWAYQLHMYHQHASYDFSKHMLREDPAFYQRQQAFSEHYSQNAQNKLVLCMD
jgi:hypothetical protein